MLPLGVKICKVSVVKCWQIIPSGHVSGELNLISDRQLMLEMSHMELDNSVTEKQLLTFKIFNMFNSIHLPVWFEKFICYIHKRCASSFRNSVVNQHLSFMFYESFIASTALLTCLNIIRELLKFYFQI